MYTLANLLYDQSTIANLNVPRSVSTLANLLNGQNLVGIGYEIYVYTCL